MRVFHSRPQLPGASDIIAVIDIGSSSLRLLIAEQEGTGWNLIDRAEQPLALGRDVFHTGSIERKTVNQTVGILKGFQELMAPYEVNRVMAIGTNAVRESKNRELFIDRILLETGIEIRVLDGLEAGQLNWLAIRDNLHDSTTNFGKSDSLIIEVGAGNTCMILLKNGKVIRAENLPIGTLRFLQQLEKELGSATGKSRSFFRRHSTHVVTEMSAYSGFSRVSRLVVLGGHIRVAAQRMGRSLKHDFTAIKREEFQTFIRKVESLSIDEIVSRLDMPWSEAELLYPGLAIVDTFLSATRAEEIIVPSTGLSEGLLVNYAASEDTLSTIFAAQVLSGAKSLARYYRCDMRHAEFVRKQALLLYDRMEGILGLNKKQRHLLETAAILHDLGRYVAHSGHHKHGQYIVMNSEIFGLTSPDKRLIGHIVRYHRRAEPQSSHNSYMALPRRERIVVQKLAALLRLAEALDRSHKQKIIISHLSLTKKHLLIHTRYPGDLSLEFLDLREKGKMFEKIFGISSVLRFDASESGR